MNDNNLDLVRPRSSPPDPSTHGSVVDRARHERLVRPRLSPTLREGFLTPNLLMGGVEHWLLGLLKNNTGQLS